MVPRVAPDRRRAAAVAARLYKLRPFPSASFPLSAANKIHDTLSQGSSELPYKILQDPAMPPRGRKPAGGGGGKRPGSGKGKAKAPKQPKQPKKRRRSETDSSEEEEERPASPPPGSPASPGPAPGQEVAPEAEEAAAAGSDSEEEVAEEVDAGSEDGDELAEGDSAKKGEIYLHIFHVFLVRLVFSSSLVAFFI